jgi:hypothetical protein
MRHVILRVMLALAALSHLGCHAGVRSAELQHVHLEGADVADVAILRDATKALRVEDLQRPAAVVPFAALNGPLRLGYEREVVWLRLHLQRAADAPRTWYLEAGNPFINDIRDGVQTFYLRMDSDSTLAGDMEVCQPAALRPDRAGGGAVFTLRMPLTA